MTSEVVTGGEEEEDTQSEPEPREAAAAADYLDAARPTPLDKNREGDSGDLEPPQ